MRFDYDKELIKSVYSEKHDQAGFADNGRYMILAMLTRFGDLAVFVYDWNAENDQLIIWQGDNVLEARRWLVNAGRVENK